MKKISIINGPNLNIIDQLLPNSKLTPLETKLHMLAKEHDIILEVRQFNGEAELISGVQALLTNKTDFLIINAGILSSSSLALQEALMLVAVPFIEIRLQHGAGLAINSGLTAQAGTNGNYGFAANVGLAANGSLLQPLAAGYITGLGFMGYELALAAAISQLSA